MSQNASDILRSPDISGVRFVQNVAHILLTLAFILLSTLAMIPALAPQPGARDVAAVYPPWWSSTQALEAASRDAQIIRPGGQAYIIIVRAPTKVARQKLQAGGAVLLLNPIAGPCGDIRTS